MALEGRRESGDQRLTQRLNAENAPWQIAPSTRFVSQPPDVQGVYKSRNRLFRRPHPLSPSPPTPCLSQPLQPSE